MCAVFSVGKDKDSNRKRILSSPRASLLGESICFFINVHLTHPLSIEALFGVLKWMFFCGFVRVFLDRTFV